MAGFKEGALQLKKKDSLAPSDVGTMKVLINSSGQMYTVNELGVSALIQGGGEADHKVISTSADTLPGTLSEKLVAGTNVYISAIGPTTSANLEIGTLGKLGVTSGDVQAYLQNKIVAGTGTIFEVIEGAYGKQIKISLDGSGGSNIDWSVITNVPIASTSTSGVLTPIDWNTFNNKQGALTSASNVRVGNLSATNLYENGVLLSSKYSALTHNHSWSNISAVPVASTSTSGVLTSTDWNTFNNKQATLNSSSNLVVNSVSATNITATNFVEAGASLSSKYLRLTGGTMTGAIVMGAAKVTSSSILGSSRNFVFDHYAGITHFNSSTQAGIGGTISPGVVGAPDGPFIYGYGGVSLGYTNQTSASGLVAALRTQGTTVYVAGSIYEAGVSLSSKYAQINHTQSWNSISGVPVASTSTSGVITLEDFNNFSNRNITTGVVDFIPPTTTYNPDGTITISSANVNLYDNPTYQGLIKTYNIGGQTLSLIDGAQQYIVADYNGGFPSFRIESNKNNINSSNIVGIYVTWRQGNNVHSIDFDSQGLQLPNKIARSILETEPYKISLDGGLVLSETSTPLSRTILVTSAVVYAGTTPHKVEPYNSSTDILTLVNHVGGVWAYTSGTTQYNNTQYDNGTSLVNMTNSSKYSVRWFYRSIGNSKEVFYVLGSNEYNSITNAQLEKQRNDLPDIIKGHCILIGRIIIKNGDSSGLVENVSTTSFNTAQVSNHNDLANIQGGAVGEYYHLSATSFNLLTSGGNTSLHNHSFDRDRANHTGTQLASTISNFVTSARTSISSTTPINYNSSTGVISISAANTNTHGYLTSADWNTFNNKQAALSTSSNLVVNSVSATNVSGSTIYEGGIALSSKYALATTNRWTTTASITIGQQTISATHNLNYQYPDIRCYDNSSNELVVLEPSYNISTTNILVIPFNSSKAHSITIIIEK